MFRELDAVALTHDVETYGLKAGDVGAVVHCYSGRSAFEVEFVEPPGRTLAVLTLEWGISGPQASAIPKLPLATDDRVNPPPWWHGSSQGLFR